ncbi:NAD-dependent deacylase [Corynebacterium callunae]|uniref:NAD-dependent deacylase n=1 Tax=Corynebacterium callunae TaxID=1721 RepID=UPI003981ECA3
MSERQLEKSIEQVIEIARAARNVEVFTGAGMSAESGLETYRDDKTGVWSKVDPQAMASIDAWLKDPEPMWAWYRWRAGVAARAEPNAGHRAIAYWQGSHLVENVHVTTQNIDDLHERGGASDVTHLHGSLFSYRCTDCETPWVDDRNYLQQPVERLTPPQCEVCGGLIRPGVVWFGEQLPVAEWDLAEQRIGEADLMVIVGTSGIVQPAATLPEMAYQRGIPIVEISPATTELTRWATLSWTATAAQALPALMREISA